EELRTCLAKDSKNADCLFLMGAILKSDGSRQELVEAQRLFKQLLSVAPNHPRVGMVREALGQIEAQLATAPPGASEAAPAAPEEGGGGGAAMIPGHEGMEAGKGSVGELNPFGQA